MTTNTTPNTRPTTAYGFDRTVTALHKGNVGIRSGSTRRSGGRTHLADGTTKITACGITVDSSYGLIVPQHGLTGEQWADRLVDCQKCRKAVSRTDRLDQPMTYAAAAAAAEQISLDELADLLAQDDNPDVYPGPRRVRRIAMGARLRIDDFDFGRRAVVTHDFCDRRGNLQFGVAIVGYRLDRPVFRFDRLDRLVQVEAPTTAPGQPTHEENDMTNTNPIGIHCVDCTVPAPCEDCTEQIVAEADHTTASDFGDIGLVLDYADPLTSRAGTIAKVTVHDTMTLDIQRWDDGFRSAELRPSAGGMYFRLFERDGALSANASVSAHRVTTVGVSSNSIVVTLADGRTLTLDLFAAEGVDIEFDVAEGTL
jgi:hypothetical protein